MTTTTESGEVMNMEYLYHATVGDNLVGISDNGIKAGCDGCVYMTDSAENAMRFMAFKWEYTEFVVFKVEVAALNPELLEESSDHSESFWKCKAWLYVGDIPTTAIEDVLFYETKAE